MSALSWWRKLAIGAGLIVMGAYTCTVRARAHLRRCYQPRAEEQQRGVWMAH
jgi:hypothetical protein